MVAWWVWLVLLLVPRGTCVFLRLSFGVGSVCRGVVFHVEQAFDGDVFVRARAYAYYGVVFRLLNVGDVVWLGGLHE